MFSFFASVFTLVWIQEHLALVIGILAALIILIVLLVIRSRRRRRAYLALPVIFIGNKATRTYHDPSCPQLRRALTANLVNLRLPKEAARFRFTPCGSCHPRWPNT